ncbi:hypothetical protein D9M72_524700 [compost metagenome]
MRGARAAPIRKCRLLTRNVIATISRICGGDVHKPMAANSEPPPKFRPVIIGTSTGLSPFWVACAPSSRANGTKLKNTGTASRKPRKASDCREMPLCPSTKSILRINYFLLERAAMSLILNRENTPTHTDFCCFYALDAQYIDG